MKRNADGSVTCEALLGPWDLPLTAEQEGKMLVFLATAEYEGWAVLASTMEGRKSWLAVKTTTRLTHVSRIVPGVLRSIAAA